MSGADVPLDLDRRPRALQRLSKCGNRVAMLIPLVAAHSIDFNDSKTGVAAQCCNAKARPFKSGSVASGAYRLNLLDVERQSCRSEAQSTRSAHTVKCCEFFAGGRQLRLLRLRGAHYRR